MKSKVFSVYDVKTAAFLQPFFALTTGAALRMFEDSVKEPEGFFNKHPADFSLHQVGEWDDSSGMFLEFPAPVHLCQAAEFVTQEIRPVEAPKVVRRSGS